MDIKWRERTDKTGARLFFQLLEAGRKLKGFAWKPQERYGFLNGMIQVMDDNREDFTIADDLRDYWRCQQSGAD